MDFRAPPIKPIANFLLHLFQDRKLQSSTVDICKACFVPIRDLKQLRGYLTHEATLLTRNAMVGSRLDNCNSLFRSPSALNLHRPQCVQNSLARIGANTTKYSYITSVRKSLHWLPIMHRLQDALLVYNFLHSG